MNASEKSVLAGEGGQASYASRAARLGLAFDPKPDRLPLNVVASARVDVGAQAAAIRDGRVALVRRAGGPHLLIAPGEVESRRLGEALAGSAGLGDRITVTTPAAIRRVLVRASAKALLDDATYRLRRLRPNLSAQRLVSLFGAIGIGLALLAFLAIIVLAGPTALAVVDILAGLLFLSIVVLRMMSISLVLDRTARPTPALPAFDRSRLPVYTILLPLHDEAHMVPDLVTAMLRLDWPRDRLDIKFLVEADDRATIAAIEALRLGPPFEMLVVPRGHPRTKPKALAFALPLARGALVTVYDAEDRPDSGQLVEAYAAFRRGDPRLACVQAPLLIDNGEENGLTGLFAMEYSIQFDGVLPMLAALGLPLPLGGTSNHFRREALEYVGGWDPFNVTEDADLGIRLARFGYRSAMIERPTYEEAPATAKLWLAQRTRWLKGWMQTFVVHMRRPWRLKREIGTRRLCGFVLTSLGSLVAAAVHPLYLANAALLLFDPSLLWRASTPLVAAMIALNLFNFIAAYWVFALLSRLTFRMRGAKRPTGALIFLPAYWLLLSLACYRALYELITDPHHWAKTPHRGRRHRRQGDARPVPRA